MMPLEDILLSINQHLIYLTSFKNTTIYSESTNLTIKSYILTLFLHRMLEKDPDQRFDINEVDDELERIDKPTPVLTTKDIFEGIFFFLI